jgi:dihydroanticapsin dehydrogenase
LRFDGRRTLIVGGAGELGCASAEYLVERGGRIVVADLEPDSAPKSLRSILDPHQVIRVDVTDEESIKAGIASSVGILGGLDAVVNFAGILDIAPVIDCTSSQWDRIFDVNARGQFLVVKHALPTLQNGDSPAIVMISSAAAFRGGSGNTAYSASKGAVVSFGRALAAELAPRVRVNVVCPGFVDTRFNDPNTRYIGGRERLDEFIERHVPLRRQGHPMDVAPYVALLTSPESGFVTGQAILIDGGMT